MEKPRVIALTKIDSVSEDIALNELGNFLKEKGETVFKISSINKQGIPELLQFLGKLVNKKRQDDIEKSTLIKNAGIPIESIWEDF